MPAAPTPPTATPWLGRFLAMVLGGLLVVAGMALVLATLQSRDRLEGLVDRLQLQWEDRLAAESTGDAAGEYAKTASRIAADKVKLAAIAGQGRQITWLVFLSLACIGLGLALVWLAYQLAVLRPLRQLARSCEDFAASGLNTPLWGMARGDSFGTLARTIYALRQPLEQLSDMVVEDASGTSHIRFGGRSGPLFQLLVDALKTTVQQLQKNSETLEQAALQHSKKGLGLAARLERHSGSLESAVDGARLALTQIHDQWQVRLESLHSSHSQIADSAKTLVAQFHRDMQTLQQIAAATATHVTSTLRTMTASDHDMKKAAAQSLQASTLLAQQAEGLTQRLSAATALLKASGKVMADTTESTRTRLLEAVHSVENRDQALQAFLSNTTEQASRFGQLLEGLNTRTAKAQDSFTQLDKSLGQFDAKSAALFSTMEAGSHTLQTHARQWAEQMVPMQQVFYTAMETMRGHSESVAGILLNIRNDYASFMEAWRESHHTLAPIVTQLKDASLEWREAWKAEWAGYARAARQVMQGLEEDLAGMHGRSRHVAADLERLVGQLASQSQRLGDNAGHVDLQLANLSQRIENAAGSVIRSNDAMLKTSGSQIESMHEQVNGMMQRLAILSQLTGTLGTVAGQLGQIVPALSDSAALQRHALPAPEPAADQLNPQILQHFEAMQAAFNSTLAGIRSECDGVRGQIHAWVAMLSEGYKGLGQQMVAMDRTLSEKIASLSAPLSKASSDPLLPALRLVHESVEKNYRLDQTLLQTIQSLQTGLQTMAGDVQKTLVRLGTVDGVVAQGFTQLQLEKTGEAPSPAGTPVQTQITRLANLLDRCAMESAAIIKNPQALAGLKARSSQNPEMPRQMLATVRTTITQLNHIAESIAQMATHPTMPPQAGDLGDNVPFASFKALKEVKGSGSVH